jgi:hypothetical protein
VGALDRVEGEICAVGALQLCDQLITPRKQGFQLTVKFLNFQERFLLLLRDDRFILHTESSTFY